MDLNTIWDETYKATRVHVDAHSELRITTAIHKSESIVCDLEFNARTTNGCSLATVRLTADQLERLAADLLDAAQRRRALDTMMACHLASKLQEAA